MADDGLITAKDAADTYQVNRSTLFRWIETGRLESQKRPRDQRTYVRRADLERVLAEEPPRRGRPGKWRQRGEDKGEG